MTSTSAVTDPAAPKVREAHGPAGDKLDIKDFYSADHVTVQVPQYTGMARGHTVRITWENPRHTHHSEVITVGTPGTIDIRIPRLEAIDSIGHTAKINYTVRTAPGTALIPSRNLLLHVLPQPFDLLPPTLSSDQKTLSVNYAGMTTGYTVRIRAVANTTWQSDERPVQAGVTPTFPLSSDWLATNRRAYALINYTVYKSGSGERLMFSKVLRVQIGEQTLPAPTLYISSGGLAGQALPYDWRYTRATNSVTINGEPNRQVTVNVSGNAQFTNASNQIVIKLDSQGRSIQPISNTTAQTVNITATYNTGPGTTGSMVFSGSFPADAVSGTASLRAKAASGAAADGTSPNRVTYDTSVIDQPITLRVQVSGSARILASGTQVANIALPPPTYDCVFDVVNTARETVVVTFDIAALGSWTRFTKQMTFT
ncbi:hypothetical protein [Pseudomonas kribbensis]|uniref:hypothetical protein n=1 Tax=Pseudomonas kribbensis TaxID=1628086 RepID=UPI001ABF8D5A|nr:hypothetical protein [Pseudomonas kribbensis]